jgi:hypothetical protein
MSFNLRVLALVSTVVLASCGGGGGGGGTAGTPPPQAVVLTETNAKPVSADAVVNVRNTSATSATVPLGVQVGTSASSSGTLQAITAAARLAGQVAAGARLPTAVSVSETDSCPLGGSITINGNIANPSGDLSAGDSITIIMATCQVSDTSGTVVMNGRMSITIISGAIGAAPFHVVLGVTAQDFSVQAGGITEVANGDVRLDWNAISDTSESLVATGAALTSRETIAGVTRTSTLRNYTQAMTTNGTTMSSTLSATVETSSTRIAASGGTYTITTPAAVVWDAVTDVVASGVIKVVGAANSQLQLTFTGGGNATIQLDANGDGTFEKSIDTTMAELNGLL